MESDLNFRRNTERIGLSIEKREQAKPIEKWLMLQCVLFIRAPAMFASLFATMSPTMF